MKIILLGAAILAAAVTTLAQGQKIERSEFEAIYNKTVYPSVRWKGRKYRATAVTGTAATNLPDKDWSSKSIQEFDGESARSIYESRIGNKEPSTSETITMSDAVYVRAGHGPWTKKPPTTPAPRQPSVDNTAMVNSEAEFRFLGIEQFRGAPTKTYLRLITGSRINEQGTEIKTVSRTKYWFDSEGTLLREEYRSDSKWNDVANWTEVILDYELDPSIEITAPIDQ